MSRFFFAAITAVAALAIVPAAPARADDPIDDTAYAKRLFARAVGADSKAYACFVRRYDAAHLARHPLQKVRVMRLLVTAERVPEDKALNYSFRLGLAFRHRSGNFDSSGDCGHPRASQISADKLHLGCSVDCDGGGITVELAHADKSTLVRLDSIRIWQNNKPDYEGFSLSGGADDRVFRLDRAKLDECTSLVADRKELAAARTK